MTGKRNIRRKYETKPMDSKTLRAVYYDSVPVRVITYTWVNGEIWQENYNGEILQVRMRLSENTAFIKCTQDAFHNVIRSNIQLWRKDKSRKK